MGSPEARLLSSKCVRVCGYVHVCPLYGFVFCMPDISLFVVALYSYMSIVESLPTYGVHYYAVKVQFYYSTMSSLSHTTHIFCSLLPNRQVGSLEQGDKTEL